jgi:hypothetical protein
VRRAALALLLTTVLAAPAAAMPGDPPVTLLDPPDGAMLPVDSAGVEVRFTCPDYRQFGDGGPFSVFGDRSDYSAEFGSSTALAANGRLQQTVALAAAGEEGDHCEAVMDNPGDGPEVTPGVYYWQAYRVCTGCPSGYETSGVRRFTLLAHFWLRMRVQRRAYAGYPVIVSIDAHHLPDGIKVSIDNHDHLIAQAAVLHEQAEAVVTLRRGRASLSSRVEFGTQGTLTQPVRVTVARPARWATSHRDDGGYGVFRVAHRGRQLRDFHATVDTLCAGRIQTGLAAVRRARIAPDGRFYAKVHQGHETTVELRGRLKHRRASGRVELNIAGCVGSRAFSERRRG